MAIISLYKLHLMSLRIIIRLSILVWQMCCCDVALHNEHIFMFFFQISRLTRYLKHHTVPFDIHVFDEANGPTFTADRHNEYSHNVFKCSCTPHIYLQTRGQDSKL